MNTLKEILISPKLLFSENNRENIAQIFRFSFVYSAFAILNWRLGAAISLNKSFGFFAFDFLLHLVLFWAILFFYLPTIHLLSETPGSMLKSFVAYSNFSTTAWFFLLPVSLIFKFLAPQKALILFYVFSLPAALYVYLSIISGISVNYHKSKVFAFLISLAPTVGFLIFVALEIIAAAGIILYL